MSSPTSLGSAWQDVGALTKARGIISAIFGEGLNDEILLAVEAEGLPKIPDHELIILSGFESGPRGGGG